MKLALTAGLLLSLTAVGAIAADPSVALSKVKRHLTADDFYRA